MPSIRDAFVSLYALANRTKTFKHPAVQRLFARGYFLYKRHVEDSFTPLIRARPGLFAGGHILDVGANIGYTAVLFAGALADGFRVYAFEPESGNFAMLKACVAEHGLVDKVFPVRAAVGDHEGVSDLWLNPANHADHRIVTRAFAGEAGLTRDIQQVPMVRLDDFCARDIADGDSIGFIKIDVQGYEECVCRGMADTLRKNPRAQVGLEYYPEGIERLGFKAGDVLNFFQQKGYHVYSLARRGGLRRADYRDIAGLVAPRGYIDLLFSKTPPAIV